MIRAFSTGAAIWLAGYVGSWLLAALCIYCVRIGARDPNVLVAAFDVLGIIVGFAGSAVLLIATPMVAIGVARELLSAACAG